MRLQVRANMNRRLRQWLADHPESVVDGKVRLPSMAERELLAKECGVEVGKISEWFWDQNRSKKRGASKLTITLPASPRGPDGSEPHGRCSACGKCAGLVAHDLLQVRVCRSCFSSLHDLGASAASERAPGEDLACRWCGNTSDRTVACADVNCPSGGHGEPAKCPQPPYDWRCAS